MTVNLTRIYTKLGDGGETHLGDMSRVSKLHPRVEAYGTSTSSTRPSASRCSRPDLRSASRTWLARVQNDLLDVGADLSVPAPQAGAGERAAAARGPRLHDWLEQACDEVNATLEPLRSFVIPGGTPAAAQLHVCRTVAAAPSAVRSRSARRSTRRPCAI